MTERLVPIAFKPKTTDELSWAMSSPLWRICSGFLYVIMPKSDTGEGTTIPFIPNRAQRKFLARMWNRNIILKARQLGYTSLIAIIWLDHALFNPDQRCGIIAQDREKAFAYLRNDLDQTALVAGCMGYGPGPELAEIDPFATVGTSL